MAKRKVVLDYDDISGELLDKDGGHIVCWVLGEEYYLKEEINIEKTSMIKDLLSSGVTIDDIIKLKNSGML